jgi:ATP-dependent helicase/nuclease subunit A
VVTIPSLSKQFNKSDLKQSVLLHQDFGFGTDTIIPSQRIKIESPIKKVLKSKMDQELKSEELRVLYVAMTRAKEKLILIGSVKKVEDQIDKWCSAMAIKTTHLGNLIVRDGRSYMDWLMLALIRHKNSQVLYADTGHTYGTTLTLQSMEPQLEVFLRKFHDYELNSDKEVHSNGKGNVETVVMGEDYEEKMAWSYPDTALTQMNVSQSVSELKRLDQVEQNSFKAEQELVAYRPVFVTGEQPLTGAEKGTVYHKVMYHMKFTSGDTLEDIKQLVESLVDRRIITAKEAGIIDTRSLYAFIKDDIGQRAIAAASRQVLYKEKPFVMGILPKDFEDTSSEAYMMIQGVIDLYFEEPDGLVIVDYKTDYLIGKPIEILIERYEKQMAYYKMALEQGTGKTVKEIFLYAVSLQKTIQVPMA